MGEGREKEDRLTIVRHCHRAKNKRERRGDAEAPTCSNAGIEEVNREGVERAQVGV